MSYRNRARAQQQWKWVKLWAVMFTSIFLALVLSGVVLALGARWYIQWSLSSTIDEYNKTHPTYNKEKK